VIGPGNFIAHPVYIEDHLMSSFDSLSPRK
jgi:hypothetical protein